MQAYISGPASKNFVILYSMIEHNKYIKITQILSQVGNFCPIVA